MPEIGEIKYGEDLGKAMGHKVRFIWSACEGCNKERWVELKNGLPRNKKCKPCSQMKNSHAWKEGKWKMKDGYMIVWLPSTDFFFPMAHKKGGNIGYVLEHRLVMAKYLGRCLHDWEIVHHKGIRHSGIENKADNLIDNLELSCDLGEHSGNHSKGYRDGYQKGLADGRNKQIEELRKEIRLLRWELANQRSLAI